MGTPITELTDKIAALEAELEVELAKRRAELRVGLEKGRVVFEEELLRCHRELRTKLLRYVVRAPAGRCYRSGDLFTYLPVTVARSVRHRLSGNLLSSLRNCQSTPR